MRKCISRAFLLAFLCFREHSPPGSKHFERVLRCTCFTRLQANLLAASALSLLPSLLLPLNQAR